MLLECYDRDISYGILVNVQAGFEDVLMLGRFVEKLSSVAGYQQVRVDEGNFSAMMSGGLEHEDDTGEEDFDEYDTDEEDVDESKEFGSKSEAKMNVQRPRPILIATIRQFNQFRHGHGCSHIIHHHSKRRSQKESVISNPAGRSTYIFSDIILESPPQSVLQAQQLFVADQGRGAEFKVSRLIDSHLIKTTNKLKCC
ncbi:unnamed protein product, partial [Mesorhabditis belari]|uniref:Uncharacterized protein n=1 Tax=Mesorhabditis belari TaxID=2138241 RepID=A0AAF3FNP1_9BILA